MIVNPPDFLSETEFDKATFQAAYRNPEAIFEGWKRYRSGNAKGHLWLARAEDGAWLAAIEHPGVRAEIGLPEADIAGPGLVRYRFDALAGFYAAIRRIGELAMSLPDFPLEDFRTKTGHLPQASEAERLVVQRIGQDIFRTSLMAYWQERCPLTGISDPALLRASHILPWSRAADEQRFDVHNGLLLSALWDAAFDRGLVTFENNGTPLFSPHLSQEARGELNWRAPIKLTVKHHFYLARHRAEAMEAWLK